MSLDIVQVAEHNPPNKNKKEYENLVLMLWVTSEVTSYQATC
jgi:hypothetical protein